MQLSSSSFVERVIGAIRLDPATYEEVEHDTGATWQAAVVVAAAAIFSGVWSSGGNTQGLFGGVLAGVVFWAIFALFAYLVGAYLLRGPQTSATFGEVLWALGFSYAPSLIAILGLIPGIGFLFAFIAAVWSLIASVIALRQALEVSTGRAVAVVVVAFLAMFVVLAVIVAIFGISIVGIDRLTSRSAWFYGTRQRRRLGLSQGLPSKWLMPKSGFPAMPYVVVLGNVGERLRIADVVRELIGREPKALFSSESEQIDTWRSKAQRYLWWWLGTVILV
jgi:hypothetical protein